MSRLKNVFSFYLVFGLMIAGFLTPAANAQNNRNEREVRTFCEVLIRNWMISRQIFQTKSGAVRRAEKTSRIWKIKCECLNLRFRIFR